MLEFVVLCAVDDNAFGLNRIQIRFELADVIFFGGKDIDVVPGNACDHRHVRSVPEEFGAQVHGRAEVFVAFDHRPFVVRLQIDHAVKSFELRAHHQVGLASRLVKGMKNHGRHRGFSMAAGHDHALLGFGGEPQEFRIALNAQSQFLGALQLGVVGSGVHAENDHVQIWRDARRVPSFGVGQQSRSLESPAAGFKNLVVAPCNVMSGIGQSQGEIVHGAAANRNEVNPHESKFTSFHGAMRFNPTHFLTFAP